MASRNFYMQLIFRVLLISFSAIGMAIAWGLGKFVVAGAFLLFLILQTWYLIHYINRTNRKIAYFFDAIKNEDFTLRFPENVSVKSFKELNHSLNRVNGLIQEVHIQLQTREQYYRQILSQASIGIMTYNGKGHILFSNPTLEKLLNFQPLNHIKQLAMVDQELYEIFAGFDAFDSKIFKLVNERENNQLIMRSTSMSMDGEAVLVVMIQDIHKELNDKESESWVRLIRVLTHEILNTITPITSLSESLLSYFKRGDGIVAKEEKSGKHMENAIRGLEVIKDQGTDLMKFVQSYRSFLNLPAPDKSLVPVQRLLDRVSVMLDQEGKNTDLQFEVSVIPDDLELYVDERQISQVLINLTKNALHALEGMKNGSLHILAGAGRNGKKFIEVTDNGPGIPSGQIDEIFVPFYTTKVSGTGIGLSLSRQIVHRHGGSLTVHSVPGEKTTFTIRF